MVCVIIKMLRKKESPGFDHRAVITKVPIAEIIDIADVQHVHGDEPISIGSGPQYRPIAHQLTLALDQVVGRLGLSAEGVVLQNQLHLVLALDVNHVPILRIWSASASRVPPSALSPWRTMPAIQLIMEPIMYITRMCGLPQSHGHSDRAGVGDLDDLAVYQRMGRSIGFFPFNSEKGGASSYERCSYGSAAPDDLAVQVDGGAGLGRELHLIGLSIQVADLLALRDHVIIQVDIDPHNTFSAEPEASYNLIECQGKLMTGSSISRNRVTVPMGAPLKPMRTIFAEWAHQLSLITTSASSAMLYRLIWLCVSVQ